MRLSIPSVSNVSIADTATEICATLVGARERRSKRANTNDRRADRMRRLEVTYAMSWRLSEVL